MKRKNADIIRRKLYELIMSMVSKEIKTTINNETNESAKSAFIGGLMGLSVLGGMLSCSNNLEYNSPDKVLVSIDKWSYKNYIGNDFKASVCIVDDKNYIVNLLINAYTYKQEQDDNFATCVWIANGGFVPRYIGSYSDKEGPYDIYYTEERDASGGDMRCFFEFHFAKDERLSKSESLQYIKVYHDEIDKDRTTFIIYVDEARENGDISFY